MYHCEVGTANIIATATEFIGYLSLDVTTKYIRC